MSNLLLIRWFENLLFGSQHVHYPPKELMNILLRLEVENISWSHTTLQGGLTALPYNVQGDLNMLIDYLEKRWLDDDEETSLKSFRTRDVSRFWKQLQILLSRHKEKSSELIPLKQDDDILKNMLTKHSNSHYAYESPSFWGEIARRFLNVRRPMNELTPLPVINTPLEDKLILLYDVTCQSYGQQWDPLSMYLVPRSGYLNSMHWQSGKLLELFMQNNPKHLLTKSIQTLLQRSINEIMHGEKPKILQTTCPRLDALLHNVNIIHKSIPEVPFQDEPPKLVDVFQRLLALCHQDSLWEKDVSIESRFVDELTGMDHYMLLERLQLLERENKLLWKQIEFNQKHVSEFAPMPKEHICPDLYAMDMEK